MPAVGFIEPWSIKAGASANAFISCIDAHASVRIVSLDRDDPEQMSWEIKRHSSSLAVRQCELGSWIELPAIRNSTHWELRFELLLTKNDFVKPVCSVGGLCVRLDENGYITVRTESDTIGLCQVANEQWYEIAMFGFDNKATISVLRSGHIVGEAVITFTRDESYSPRIGFDGEPSAKTLNARIGRISMQDGSILYSWRFPTRGPVGHLSAIEDPAIELKIHNMPTFSVASARFDSTVHDPRLEPTHFDAVHLHDDDFGGFDWPADFTFDVPTDARSGIFAFEISTSEGTEKLPFFVRPLQPQSSLAFLAPTSTYLAYADERLPPVRYPWHGTDRGHRFSFDNDLLCLYDVHSDLSGVSLTSTRRPRATLRDDYHYPLSNSPHLLPVDLQLLKFYAREGVDIDILTDRDLHDEGLAAIATYRGLMTGSHPEYWSTPMMKALHEYLDRGGNLAYLGGNGFYWVVAYQDEVMELRRGKSDIWTGRPGEGHMSITGEPGGNWEDRGLHNPQSYLGVTYLIMSFGPARPYRRLEASFGSEYDWLFREVDDGPIGDSGTVLGGAAGYEVDAVIRSEETPKNLVRLATADDFDDSFQVRPEIWLADGDAERETLRRADMTIYRHTGGGEVFCTGSVAWIGSLPERGTNNNVGTIMKNLAERFGNWTHYRAQ